MHFDRRLSHLGLALNLNNSEPSIRAAAELIADADALIIAAGAGIGVDSGLPDSRGNEGFWRAYPAATAWNCTETLSHMLDLSCCGNGVTVCFLVCGCSPVTWTFNFKKLDLPKNRFTNAMGLFITCNA